MSGLGLLLLILAGIAVICVVIQDAHSRPLDAHRSFTAEDPACKAVAKEQEKARERMKALGHRSLLDGRRAWQTIKTMDTEAPAKVLPMRRKR